MCLLVAWSSNSHFLTKAHLSAWIFRKEMRVPYQTTDRAGVVATLYSQVPASNLSREIRLH